jgi:Flp pilus assembly protein TadB
MLMGMSLMTALVVFSLIAMTGLDVGLFMMILLGLGASAIVWVLATGLGPILETVGAGGLFGLLFLSALVIGAIANRRDKAQLGGVQNKDN